MRMSHYYYSLMVLSIGGLLATSIAGLLGSSMHLGLAIATAMIVVGMHSLVILFVLICSRVLREGQRYCGLGENYLVRSNDFFRDRSGFHLALVGALSIVAAGVLGYAERGFGLPTGVHLVAGLGAMLLTFFAVPRELVTLWAAERLLDEARRDLDQVDRDRAAQGRAPVDAEHLSENDSLARTGLSIMVAPGLVYLYRVVIVEHGDLTRVSLLLPGAVSLVGLGVWFVGRRRERSLEA